jgi:hypothetical protein
MRRFELSCDTGVNMKIPQMLLMTSALLFAAGCAHEQQKARFYEGAYSYYSAGGASANVAAGKTGSQSDNTIVASVR